MRVLSVDADPALGRLLGHRLASDGVAVDHAAGVAAARRLLADRAYAAVVLEPRLPDGDGLTVVQTLRDAPQPVPVLVVSGVGGDEAIIRALEAGADDYVVKPASPELLRARLRALLRRSEAHYGGVRRVGALTIDRVRREAWVGDAPLGLTAREFDLLAHLVARADQVQSRDALLAAVWGRPDDAGAGDADTASAASAASNATSNVVDVAVGRVRRRLPLAPDVPAIEAVRGVGYVLRSPGRLAARAARAGFAAALRAPPGSPE